MNKAANAYFQTQVGTTSQSDLLLMLYDGAIKFLNQAKDKIEEKNFAEKGILLSKAIDVISELDASLNPEKGGDLADNLHKLYFYCNTRLLNANLKMDTSYVDEVIKILSGLREAFAQVAAQGAPQPDAPSDRSGPSINAAQAAQKHAQAMPSPGIGAQTAPQRAGQTAAAKPVGNVYPMMAPPRPAGAPAGGARNLAGANIYRKQMAQQTPQGDTE